MRLLHTTKLTFEEFFDQQIPAYSILSHRWGSEEVSFQDFESKKKRKKTKKKSEGYQKILKCCELSRERGFEWTWIDTCCIDKKSSSELSEAINSMFRWYEKAQECYAFLNDVEWKEEEVDRSHESFCESLWFTRGWTLQELLAPYIVMFFDKEWKYIGTKYRLGKIISTVTGIPVDVLESHFHVDIACVAQKMSWVATRRTSRTEDMAYCMLGLFGINMSLLYGEGEKAFYRLQLEIIKESNDESIFAWFAPKSGTYWTPWYYSGLFAPHPRYFAASGTIRHLYNGGRRQPWSMTNVGLVIHVPDADIAPDKNTATLRLACWDESWQQETEGVADGIVALQSNNVHISLETWADGEIIYVRVDCKRVLGKTPHTCGGSTTCIYVGGQ